jgi:AcrR family transcriptional regulator
MSPRTKEQNLIIRAKMRERIIHSSMKLFGQNGFERTSVNAIAKDAKISKGLIYYHFETKESIVIGIVNMLMDMGQKIITPEIHFESPKHHLKYTIDEYFNLAKQEAVLLSWMLPMAFQIGRYPFVTKMIAQKTKYAIGTSKQLFEKLGYPDPEQEAWFFGALMDGISMDQILVPNYDSKRMHQHILNKYELNNI